VSSGDSSQVTISHIFGELVWLFTQSPRHAALPVGELAWQLMPAIARRQFHLFREGDRPVGAAIWASMDESGEQCFLEDRFHPPHVGEDAWSAGDRLWLVDLVAPFATEENKQADVMFGDLVTGPLKGRAFKMLHVDPETGARQAIPVAADTGERLSRYVAEQVG
jgi:cytolysin-activating lysine-acyltransferase